MYLTNLQEKNKKHFEVVIRNGLFCKNNFSVPSRKSKKKNSKQE